MYAEIHLGKIQPLSVRCESWHPADAWWSRLGWCWWAAPVLAEHQRSPGLKQWKSSTSEGVEKQKLDVKCCVLGSFMWWFCSFTSWDESQRCFSSRKFFYFLVVFRKCIYSKSKSSAVLCLRRDLTCDAVVENMSSPSTMGILEHCLLGLWKRFGVDLPQAMGRGGVRLGVQWWQLHVPHYMKSGKGEAFQVSKTSRGWDEATASQPDVRQKDDPWQLNPKAGVKPPTRQHWRGLYSLLFHCP